MGLLFIIFIAYLILKSRTSGNTGYKYNQSRDYNCKCPYCKKMYYLEDGYYVCECGENFRKDGSFTYKSDETVSDIIQYTIELMAYISKADGIVTNEEVNCLRQLLKDADFNNTQINWCARIFNKYKAISYDKSVLYKIKGDINDSIDLKRGILFYALEISYTDGEVSYSQNTIIDDIVSILGISISDYESIKNEVIGNGSNQENRKQLDEYYKILNITPGSSHAEVKKAYRDLMKIYHPDKQASKGLPDEIIKDITEKSVKIQEAYDEIKKAEGF